MVAAAVVASFLAAPASAGPAKCIWDSLGVVERHEVFKADDLSQLSDATFNRTVDAARSCGVAHPSKFGPVLASIYVKERVALLGVLERGGTTEEELNARIAEVERDGRKLDTTATLALLERLSEEFADRVPSDIPAYALGAAKVSVQMPVIRYLARRSARLEAEREAMESGAGL